MEAEDPDQRVAGAGLLGTALFIEQFFLCQTPAQLVPSLLVWRASPLLAWFNLKLNGLYSQRETKRLVLNQVRQRQGGTGG